MTDPENVIPKKSRQGCGNLGGATSGIYGLAFIGALIYYFQQADSFTSGLVGFLKALVWPAILAYELLQYLNV